ncbi:hypothetical protein BD310DRAFT_934163 [Dichomitus squalens]|uniref:Uncharacterized protein n=1 Tax=Dichomitus squalens TaxID=114155 RepID=A0A4Q9PM11_9APHY|nr:hypothetical protein BD310DRAFT_934163 [Dichomitus squalens]
MYLESNPEKLRCYAFRHPDSSVQNRSLLGGVEILRKMNENAGFLMIHPFLVQALPSMTLMCRLILPWVRRARRPPAAYRNVVGGPGTSRTRARSDAFTIAGRDRERWAA